MPFTFSHPAIILPLAYLPKKWFSLTGLIIGSMAPDFEYFLRMKVQSTHSHTLSGLLYFNLPLALLLAYIFHNFVRDTLFDNLPGILKSRIAVFMQFDWNAYFKKHWIAVCVSVLIGALSHIIWDSFTHEHGYFVKAIPQLKNTIALFGKELPLFKILQHSSTVLGGLLITYTILKLPVVKNVKGNLYLNYWGILIFLTLLIIAIRILSGLHYKLYGHLIVTAISAVLISLVLTPLVLRLKNHKINEH